MTLSVPKFSLPPESYIYMYESRVGYLSGAGVNGPGIKELIPLAQYATVIQSEIFALLRGTQICNTKGYSGTHISIFSGSRSAIRTFNSLNALGE